MQKNWLLRKDPDAEKHRIQEEKGTTRDEMVAQHHQLNGRESERSPGVGDGQGSLVFCSPWGHRESYTTEQLNPTRAGLLYDDVLVSGVQQSDPVYVYL